MYQDEPDIYDDFSHGGEDLFDELEDVSSLDDFDNQHVESGGHDLTLINLNDYSLNSPIISDELVEFKKFLNGQAFRDSWNKTQWEESKSILIQQNISHQVGSAGNDLHKQLGAFFLSFILFSSSFLNLLSKVDQDIRLGNRILRAFTRGWINKTCESSMITSNLSDDAKKYGTIFWITHWLINIINCKDPREFENLKKVIDKFEDLDLRGSTKSNCIFDSKSLGKIFLVGNFIYFDKLNLLCNRNITLMMKDTALARFNSLVSISSYHDRNQASGALRKQESLYKSGDIVLSQIGNQAYEVFRLIEPICNLRFSETSHAFRPLIPVDKGYESHINLATFEAVKLNHSVGPFLNQIRLESDLFTILNFYGSFRHWGHPEINYLEGLKKLNNQVNLTKQIDDDYANRIASDLAYKVLSKMFKKKGDWFVDRTKMSDDHPLFHHIQNNTWPTKFEEMDFGDNWHSLPLIKCFEVPEVIDPGQIYSDKSHSMNRADVINWVRRNPNKPIPSKRVLETYLKTKGTDWKIFLKSVNDSGLNRDDLIIGLKAKEREIKVVGRFFALMSWKLREYFVSTEYLIKQHYVPLFKGLTMADDFATVTKKMMDRVGGQGVEGYENITFANHIDYEKWNNHQRLESTGPTFEVMGKFLGYPDLIKRTHEFFQGSLIYYNQRPDLMYPVGDSLQNRGQDIVCWEGQKGGLEGLRQKGWSVLNLLVIERESLIRNTAVSVLAQGDNQVVCTHYKLDHCGKSQVDELKIRMAFTNNQAIMSAIERGTSKLGLIINKDETITSSDFLNYGKIPIWRGNICPLTIKRWSRVNCVTNDQLPSLASIMSTVSTNALTVANFSDSPIGSMQHLVMMGSWVRNILDLFNPAIRGPVDFNGWSDEALDVYKLSFLFLDPSLGGVSGTSLNRFLIRGFPDPVTESLSFWKIVHKNLEPGPVKILVEKILNIPVKSFHGKDFKKLLENPMSLNIPKGVSAEVALREEIRHQLISNHTFVQNDMIKTVLSRFEVEESDLLNMLIQINPRFPRFLTEFKNATFVGIADSLMGLFQNSNTLRRLFKKNQRKNINLLIVKSEQSSIDLLSSISKRVPKMDISSTCTSTEADRLRMISWGSNIIGTTVPHPIEGFQICPVKMGQCPCCSLTSIPTGFVTTISRPSTNLYQSKGPFPPYLGSRTSESTSILMPWEKETKIPIISRASNLRKAVGWFVTQNSNIAQSIVNNLSSLTGESVSVDDLTSLRTGSAVHRYSSDRQSSGGYNSISPTPLTRLFCTTDTLSDMMHTNYDFMYQSLLIYSQVTVNEIQSSGHERIYHSHPSCLSCLREVNEVTLDCPIILNPPDKSGILTNWKPLDTPWFENKIQLPTSPLDWDSLSHPDQSFHIGRMQGFLYCLLMDQENHHYEDSSLFPFVLTNKLITKDHLDGLMDGIIRAASIAVLTRSHLYIRRTPKLIHLSQSFHYLSKIVNHAPFNTFVSHKFYQKEFSKIPHRIPPSYPVNKYDISALVRNYLRGSIFDAIVKGYKSSILTLSRSKLVLFADTFGIEVAGPLYLTDDLLQILGISRLTSENMRELRELNAVYKSIMRGNVDLHTFNKSIQRISFVGREIRHTMKDVSAVDNLDPDIYQKWGPELIGEVFKTPIFFDAQESRGQLNKIYNTKPCPLISGLREFQCATGSHKKLISILSEFRIKYSDFISMGDGSGGLTSLLLRRSQFSRGIFNSLMNFQDCPLRGFKPPPPSAITAMGSMSQRCVNLTTVWGEPNDLTDEVTWGNFKRLKQEFKLYINLIVMDMEPKSNEVRKSIESNLSRWCDSLLEPDGFLIIKTYLDYLDNPELLMFLGNRFNHVFRCQTEFTSCFSSEIYLVCHSFKNSSICLHPSWTSINNTISDLMCHKSPEEEFRRAVRMKDYDFWKGVPLALNPNKWDQLGEVLEQMGVHPGDAFTARSWSLCSNKITSASDAMILFINISNKLIPSTKRNWKQTLPPSDSSILNFLAWAIGFGYIWSWIQEDLDLFNFLNEILNKPIPFNWRFRENPNDQNMLRNALGMRHKTYKFNWCLRRHLGKQKYFGLSNKFSLLGRIIRSLKGVLDLHDMKFTGSELNRKFRVIDKNLTLKLIQNDTGILDILVMRKFSELSHNPEVNSDRIEDFTIQD